MGYNPSREGQWTHDDLARATAAKDYAAINAARKSGLLRDALNPTAPEADPLSPEQWARLSDHTREQMRRSYGAQIDPTHASADPAPAGPTVPGEGTGAGYTR